MSSIEIQENRYLVWLNTFEPSKQDVLENYLDWIIQEHNDNGVSDVFILTPMGKLIVKKCSSVHAEAIIKWASDNVAKDTLNELIRFLDCGKLKHIDYILHTIVLRLLYVSIGECPVVVGFVNPRNDNMDMFDKIINDYTKVILEYPCPSLLEPLVVLYFYEPTQYPVSPLNRAAQDLGGARFFAFDTEDNGRNPIGNCIGADISQWIRTGRDRPKIIYLSQVPIITPFNEVNTSLFTNQNSEWINFLKRVLNCNRIECDRIDNPECPQEMRQELVLIGGTHSALTSMGANPKLTLQLTFRGD